MEQQPSGTITFLFTDIEGSTKLWEEWPEAMRLAVARHDALLRQAVAENSGYLFKTTGDGIAAAFALAPDALAATLAAQIALAAEPWPEAVTLRSRMSLHTGAAELRDGDYFGSTLNRAARLMAAGHGGQVLISDVTHELCRDSLPPDVTLPSLGEQRLKDLARPETVFQMAHPALIATFPPLRTLDNPDFPNNLPLQLTSFVGREKPLADVSELLEKTRLLTLTGAGGSGKTRLSLQASADALDGYPDGVWLVELAALSDPTLVPQTVASALGVKEQPGQSLMQTLIEHVKAKRLLLLLDNAEHLLKACAVLVTALLRACPQIKVLVTSREPLGVGGETTYRVPTLTLPGATQVVGATADSLSQFEAVRLFIERAQAVKPGFAVTNANAPALAQLCCRLDGIPLAIELAAARVRSMSVEQINDKLDSRFRLLTGGDRSALPRQQTLRALIDWSYDLLGENEKILLARLSVFAGGWTLEAAEKVCGFEPIGDWEMLDLLTSLTDKSLIHADEDDQAGTRYRMLETVLQYASGRLSSSDEKTQVQQSLLRWGVELAEEAEPMLEGPDQVAWLNRLESEHENLRAALEVSVADREEAGGTDSQAFADTLFAGLRISSALLWYWARRGYATEGLAYLARALALWRAYERLESGSKASTTEDDSSALSLKRVVAGALASAGILARMRDNVESQTRLEESLGLFREIGDKAGMALALHHLGGVAGDRGGSPASRRAFYEESLRLRREIGDKHGIAKTLMTLGRVAASEGDDATAMALYEESLLRFREIGDKVSIAMSGAHVGGIAHKLGDRITARARYEECLRLAREVGTRGELTANGLEGIASLWNEEDKVRQAVVLWAAARADLLRFVSATYPFTTAEEEQFAQMRAALGADEFESAWDEGAALKWDRAIQLALGETASA